jgi:hypothetical protein
MAFSLVKPQMEARRNSSGIAVVICILNQFEEKMGRFLIELIRKAAANLV